MLLNSAAIKRTALGIAKQRFQGTAYEDKFTRVSKDLVDAAESHMRQWLIERINNMPTIGKTIH